MIEFSDVTQEIDFVLDSDDTTIDFQVDEGIVEGKTYTLSKEGDTIYLRDNNGTESHVTDSNTTYSKLSEFTDDLGNSPAHTHSQYVVTEEDPTVPTWAKSKQGIIDVIYPVGSIYMSTANTSPAIFLGGTWERIMDRFLLSAGDTYNAGTTGGSADAVLVSHNHKVSTESEYFVTSEMSSALNAQFVATSSGTKFTDGQASSGTFHHRSYTNTQGEVGAGKNMPPYLTVYMWERTA